MDLRAMMPPSRAGVNAASRIAAIAAHRIAEKILRKTLLARAYMPHRRHHARKKLRLRHASARCIAGGGALACAAHRIPRNPLWQQAYLLDCTTTTPSARANKLQDERSASRQDLTFSVHYILCFYSSFATMGRGRATVSGGRRRHRP
ncbi:MAG: hypothetical protein ISP90_05810 [Nevskia sp.]|nr:hypothetical protein [Nevskia sp.]